MTDEPIKISALIQKRKRKNCTCKNRRFEVDTENREVTCKDCGQVIDTFEAMVEISEKHSLFRQEVEHLRFIRDDLIKWHKNNRAGAAIKSIASYSRRGEMIPFCPVCKQPFELHELVTWGNSKLYKNKIEARKKDN